MPGYPLDGPVGQVLIQVVGLTVLFRRLVIPHNRDELMDVRGHKTVGVVESLAGGPSVKRPHLGDFVQWRVVPLANGIIHIARLLQVVRH